MDDNAQVDFNPFRGGEISRRAPSTEPQREILTAALLDDVANTAYNEAISMRIEGPIGPEAVERAFRQVIDRHDALRMTFTPAGTEVCVTDENDFALEVRDLSDKTADEQEEAIQALWTELAGTPINLIDGPLLRAIWLKLGDNAAELLVLVHHAVCDGWSYYVVIEELAAILSGKADELSGPAASFADFAEHQAASTASNKDFDYWLDKFKSVPPPLDLPLDRPRPATRTWTATRTDYVFDGELTQSIRGTAGKLRASMVNVVLAAVAVLLHRLSKADDIAIGLPVARQSTDNMPDLVGHGVQLLPMRFGVSADDSFGDLVGRAKSEVLDATDHPNFTFGSLIRELNLSGDPSRVPLVPVIFNIDQPSEPLQFGDATATIRTIPRSAEPFEMFLNVLPSADVLTLEMTYNTDLFDSETIDCWLQALESILVDVAGEPTKAIGDIRLSHDTPACYADLNDTLREHEHEHWLSALEQQVTDRPDATAVIDIDGSITYAEFDTLSNQYAAELVQQGVGPGDLVGIYMNRSRQLLAAATAVHKAGAAYVPMDPSFPESRLVYMLKDSGAKLIVSDIDLPAALTEAGVPVLSAPPANGAGATFDVVPRSGDDLAYVIYTSGSTGNPKGVEVHHDAVANFLTSMAREPGIDADSRLLAVTTLSFDISVLELFLPLFRGASVYVATREEGGDARALAELIEAQSITIMQATPATWKLLLVDDWEGNKDLKALCGGEPLPADLARTLSRRTGSLWNMYGPTETTIWSTCCRVEPDFARITVGRPIDNTDILILDGVGRPLPATIPGELCIGGRGVALGYHDRPELTAEKFVSTEAHGRIYRTGDLARVLPNGEIEHLGRMDDQVKVRGFRIELGEIETVLQAHEDVEQAAVHVWAAKEDDYRIVACLKPASGRNISPVKLRKHVRAHLPEYMMPQYFLPVDAIPLTPNGKVDRRNLPSPVLSESQLDKAKADPPETPAEVIIADIWKKLIQPARAVRRHDMFFEIGGHSLLALTALRQIEDKFNIRLDPRALFAHDLAAIAEQCGEATEGGADVAALRPTRLADDARKLLSANQERILRDCLANPDTLGRRVLRRESAAGLCSPFDSSDDVWPG
jgi:amino acid adenylation domain-containing protein